jgi:hypothetical protein
MALEPIRVELTDFQKLEILREEEEHLAEEFAEVERQLREALLSAARQQYLTAFGTYYRAAGAGGEKSGSPAELESRRALVGQTLEAVTAQRQQYETALGVSAKSGRGRRAGPPGAAATRKGRFDTFEDFRQNQPPG